MDLGKFEKAVAVDAKWTFDKSKVLAHAVIDHLHSEATTWWPPFRWAITAGLKWAKGRIDSVSYSLHYAITDAIKKHEAKELAGDAKATLPLSVPATTASPKP